MHNSTNGISNEVIKKLNDSANRKQINKFRKAFNSLSHYHKECYRHIVMEKLHIPAMSGILNTIGEEKALHIFNKLLQENKDFAFKTLDVISPQYTLFRTLFGALNQYESEYIQHVKAKSKGSKAMSGILNTIGEEKALHIFNKLLQENKDFAFKTLDVISPQYTLFRTLFGALNQYESEYIQHVKAKSKGSKAMSGILNTIGEEKALHIFNKLLQENKDFAFQTLDVISPQYTLFRTLFGALNQYESEYIQHVKAKSKGSAMFGILNTIGEKNALHIFNKLLQENKDFAFQTLDVVSPQYTLFRTLFDTLDTHQKEDYKIYLEKKTTVQAQFTLRKFYSNNKNGASKLRTENPNKDSLDNELLAQKRKRADSDEFSVLNPASFFPSSVTLEKMVDKYEFDTRADFSYDEKNQLCSQTIYWITGKQPSNSLQYLALKGFNKLTKHELEEICTVEPAAKRQRIL